MASSKKYPTQGQMLLPVLDALASASAPVATRDIYDAVASATGIERDRRKATVKIGDQEVNPFERSVRWAQQRAKLLGLASTVGKDRWQLEARGHRSLTEAAPGKVFTIWTTEQGVALWGRCEDVIGMVEPGSVDLLLTSPPYPLETKKSYGGYGQTEERAYLDWLLRLSDQWGETLAPTGSCMINLGDVWRKGIPSVSLYQERLLVELQDKGGWHLLQRLSWFNPAALATPAAFVSVRRIRVKQSSEQILWLSRDPDKAYADNRAVATPYGSAMRAVLEAGGQQATKRPSGHSLSVNAFSRDNGGSIPPNVITAANTCSNDAYLRGCRENGMAVHPARFPSAIADFAIKLASPEGGLVFDPMSGSFTVAEAAERLGRRWIGCDQMLEYVRGGALRLQGRAIAA
jgi:site-specific DNA-methyltransferase (cytosine-N4-specific)